jgi:hypothetical protein
VWQAARVVVKRGIDPRRHAVAERDDADFHENFVGPNSFGRGARGAECVAACELVAPTTCPVEGLNSFGQRGQAAVADLPRLRVLSGVHNSSRL